jgi:hypothetical protein
MQIAGLIFIAIWLAAIVGWVMNIVTIFHTATDPVTGIFIFRCVGVVVAPVGAILGYF